MKKIKVFVIFLVPMAAVVRAAPSIESGQVALRHDILRLADYGVISSPVSTWPLPWGPILDDIEQFDEVIEVPKEVRDAISRVLARGKWETRTDETQVMARVALTEGPTRIRSFQQTPREESEVSLGLSRTGARLAVNINLAGVSDPIDGDRLRFDGSEIALGLGNYTISLSTLDRWWGPAWDSSLILSSNARPIPALTINRRFTDAFGNRWLRWLGPWDLSLIWGQLEKERVIPNAKFLGFRMNFKPAQNLEIGISRSAQWCGEGRPCGADIFWDLVLGNDNRGDDDITLENEPGNQTAGVDFRWVNRRFGSPIAFYGHFLAEDEAGGFPSRYLGQLGLDSTGMLKDRWSYRWYLETAVTSCDFWKSDEIFDCAYNHYIYQTGYRYKGRVIGHAADNDARVLTIGGAMVAPGNTFWHALIRVGRLNRGGTLDAENSLTIGPQNYSGVELIHSRATRLGRFDFGVGYHSFDKASHTLGSREFNAFIQWNSDT